MKNGNFQLFPLQLVNSSCVFSSLSPFASFFSWTKVEWNCNCNAYTLRTKWIISINFVFHVIYQIYAWLLEFHLFCYTSAKVYIKTYYFLFTLHSRHVMVMTTKKAKSSGLSCLSKPWHHLMARDRRIKTIENQNFAILNTATLSSLLLLLANSVTFLAFGDWNVLQGRRSGALKSLLVIACLVILVHVSYHPTLTATAYRSNISN